MVASLMGILVGGGILWLIAEVYFRFPGAKGLGMGDVKMLAMVGAFLGLKLVILTFILSSLIGGGGGGSFLIASRRGEPVHRCPFRHDAGRGGAGGEPVGGTK